MRKSNFAMCRMPFGESGAKQSQDDKPLTHQRLVRTASVDDALRSHLSLRSRRGREVSATWPLLPRLSSAPHIPARPFGLGWRFDVARSVTPNSFELPLPKRLPNFSGTRLLPHSLQGCKPRRFRVVEAYPTRTRSRVRPSREDLMSLGAPPNRTEAFARSGPAEPISLNVSTG